MGDWSGQRAALLRHDVDLDLEPAARLARWLAQRNITSTFFVLVSCPHYNVFSQRSRARLKEMVDLGFEIGLHFDPGVYPGADAARLQAAATQEAGWLATVTGQAVRSLSLHNPHNLSDLYLFEGFLNAYDPRIFAPDRYISDSCRRFRSDPGEFLTRVADAPHPIQILLHPLHYDKVERDYQEIFDNYFARTRSECDLDFRRANPTYVQEVAELQ
jgi:peptidoglycan/xylan/chitin deacetylase (PgdA/CDA1 family)